MPKRDIVVVGASFGGVETLKRLVAGLPKRFPAAVFIAQHLPADPPSLLPQILERVCPLPVESAQDRAAIEPGRIYVAPSDHHLLLEPGRMRVNRGPKVNNHRPAVDALFRSAASAFGPRTIGAVLTGALDCGSAGLVAIKQGGGLAVVQDPDDAICPDMPLHALETVDVDHVVLVEKLPRLLARLIKQEVRMPRSNRNPGRPPPKETEIKHYSCPGCGGALEETGIGKVLQFRCHMGHGYSPLNLDAAQGQALEAALWTALRTLEEQARLTRRMADRAAKYQHRITAQRYDERARTAEEQAELIRTALRLPEGRSAD